MPVIFGTTITGVSYSQSTHVLSVNGYAFAENQYAGVSNIEISRSGAGVWTAVDVILTWGDTAVSGSFVLPLAQGSYDVRVTSSDGEVSNTYPNGIFIAGGPSMSKMRIAISMGI